MRLPLFVVIFVMLLGVPHSRADYEGPKWNGRHFPIWMLGYSEHLALQEARMEIEKYEWPSNLSDGHSPKAVQALELVSGLSRIRWAALRPILVDSHFKVDVHSAIALGYLLNLGLHVEEITSLLERPEVWPEFPFQSDALYNLLFEAHGNPNHRISTAAFLILESRISWVPDRIIQWEMNQANDLAKSLNLHRHLDFDLLKYIVENLDDRSNPVGKTIREFSAREDAEFRRFNFRSLIDPSNLQVSLEIRLRAFKLQQSLELIAKYADLSGSCANMFASVQ